METKTIKSQLVIMFLVSICSAAAILDDDESSLLAFMARLTSNSILAKNWSQGTTFCQWIGVTCSPGLSRVAGLDLFEMGLEGTIGQEIGNLSFLTYLDLSNNSFYGQIPDEIGGLRSLRVLRMANNQLNGRIPLSFGSLINLERLNLSGNLLSGEIPWSVFNLSARNEINLLSNQLSGTLPLDICENQLRNLQILSLRDNQIGGDIPNSLCNCVQLQKLDLVINKFTGSIPMGIGNLSQLQFLGIGRSTLIDDQRMAQTKTLGTIGYMAPEYGSAGIVSIMVDVYSYGILLMETFLRTKPTDEMFSGELTFKKWVFESFPHSIIRIADANLLNTDDEFVIAKYESCLISIMGLALECTADLPERRPNMKHILSKMNKIKTELLF